MSDIMSDTMSFYNTTNKSATALDQSKGTLGIGFSEFSFVGPELTLAAEREGEARI